MKLKNFAKIKDSDIEFNNLTILAGKPSTNKSYIMKFKYSIDETFANINSGKFIKLISLMETDNNNLDMIKVFSNFEKLEIDIDKLIDNGDFITIKKKFEKKDKDLPILPLLNSIIEKQKLLTKLNKKNQFEYLFRNILKSIFRDINQINEDFNVEINKNKIEFKENTLYLNIINFESDIENVIFIETPLILEFEKFLPNNIASMPYHIDSLTQILRKESFAFTNLEEEEFINKFNEKVNYIINGSIQKEQSNFIYKNQDGKIFNIVNTSSGVKSIGLLQYLVNNKILKKGSTLYWEEPEVHLHPEWQRKIAELFLFMIDEGIKIVISTHSAILTNSLNILSKNKEKISFNLLKREDNKVKNIVLNNNNWYLIQDELLETLEELSWEYL